MLECEIRDRVGNRVGKHVRSVTGHKQVKRQYKDNTMTTQFFLRIVFDFLFVAVEVGIDLNAFSLIIV